LRVVWLFVVLVLCGWCSVWICPHLKETIVFRIEFLSQVTCLYEFQDRALERYRPYQKKKNLLQQWDLKPAQIASKQHDEKGK
jgi:hypothetical protein